MGAKGHGLGKRPPAGQLSKQQKNQAMRVAAKALGMPGTIRRWHTDDLDVDHHSTPLTGWRYWHLVMQDGEPTLSSVVTSHTYDGPVAVSEEDPAETQYGFFAMKQDYDFYEEPDACRVVYGKVEMFGTVVEHEHGFRAEKIRIAELRLRPGDWVDIIGTGTHSLTGVTHQFQSDAEPPWPYPYEDIVEALGEKYRCDAKYEPRPCGTQVFRGSSFESDVFAKAWGRFVSDVPDLVGESPFLVRPSLSEIAKYGGTGCGLVSRSESTRSSLRKQMSHLRSNLKKLRQSLPHLIGKASQQRSPSKQALISALQQSRRQRTMNQLQKQHARSKHNHLGLGAGTPHIFGGVLVILLGLVLSGVV